MSKDPLTPLMSMCGIMFDAWSFRDPTSIKKDGKRLMMTPKPWTTQSFMMKRTR